jgi:hypothetical protein
LGLVFAGCVLEGVSDDDKHRFLAGVPSAARMMWQLVGTRTYQGYRAKLYSPALPDLAMGPVGHCGTS